MFGSLVMRVRSRIRYTRSSLIHPHNNRLTSFTSFLTNGLMLGFLMVTLSLSACGGGGSSDGANGSNGSAILAWDAPTTNTDGSPLTTLAGYNIYYGTTPGDYSGVVDAGNSTSYQVTSLNRGQTYYFTVTAYDYSGSESDYSNEVEKFIPFYDM